MSTQTNVFLVSPFALNLLKFHLDSRICPPHLSGSKIANFSLSVLRENVGYQGWNSQNASLNSKQEKT